MYTGYKVVLVETGEPKHTEEVTGLGTVALPCQQELMTFLGNLRLVLRLVKANMYHQHTSNAAACTTSTHLTLPPSSLTCVHTPSRIFFAVHN